MLSFADAHSQASIADVQTSRVKHGPSIMGKRRIYRVIVDNEDLTPDDLVDPNFAAMDESFKHAAFDSMTRARDESQMKAALSRSKMAIAAESATMKVFATTINLDDIHIDHTLNTEEGGLEGYDDLDQAPSAFYLPKMYPAKNYPAEINIVLKETQTQKLFELPSISFEKGTPEAILIEEDNAYYEYMTVGKGRNRKTVLEETQTESVTRQTRHTLVVRPQKKNASAFASVWDMHDSYARLAQTSKPPVEDEMVLYQSAAPSLMRKKKRNAVVVKEKASKTFDDIGTTPAFFDAALITERVLASLEYGNEQKIFRGLIPNNPLALDLVYIYTMKPLWVFECAETENKAIIGVAFNKKNVDIIAVAYGKYTYAEVTNGLVGVWCTKNPCKPERLYEFDSPVTSLSFSEKNPNWLAVGFWNGDVKLLDITSYPIKTIATSSRDTNPCFDPVWSTTWRCVDRDQEYIMACCQDGRINKFTNTKTQDLLCMPMMRVATVEGKLKGLDAIKPCLKMDVPIIRYPGVMCMIWHPKVSHVYLAGTDEGCVHRCSTHYVNQHIDVFRAHAGPVYDIQICPFRENLIVTCGADSCIRLWIEGLDEMIMTLLCSAAVHSVAFCPKNATILISVSGNVLSVWDFRRKTHVPCAEYTFPGNTLLTYVRFSPKGDSVYVCDTIGRIHTFHLEDTPLPPFYQRKMLDEAIRNALCTRPHLLKQLDKLRRNAEAQEKC